MQGKTVVITGATSGIGEVAAETLAARGARIVFTARDETRAQATLRRLAAVNPAVAHDFVLADLSVLAAMVKNHARNSTSEPVNCPRQRFTRTQVSEATSSTASRWRTRR